MKVSARSNDGIMDHIGTKSYITIEGAGVQVSILQDGEFLRITVDPVGRDFIAKLNVKSVYTNDSQAQLVIAGRMVGAGFSDEAINLAINEIDRLGSQMKRAPGAKLSDVPTIQRLSELSLYLRGLRS